VGTIVVEKLDRLARQLGLQEYMLYDMRKRGFSVVSTSEEDIESADPTRVLFRQMMGAIAQYDKSMIVLKLRGARARAKAARGRCEGQKPFGSYAGEGGVLERMRDLRRSGVSAKRIAAALNTDLVPSRSGGRWHPYTVSKILSREAASAGIRFN
jgi:DNA invertase Pin-like site-specific DNA recombinase